MKWPGVVADGEHDKRGAKQMRSPKMPLELIGRIAAMVSPPP